ncbi:MAG: hypothetical protein ACJ732_08160 [Rubrobacteraceae bacterium]
MPGTRVLSDAIFRSVPETIEAVTTSADLGGKQDYEKACAQHDRYAGALDADELGCLSLRLVGGEL